MRDLEAAIAVEQRRRGPVELQVLRPHDEVRDLACRPFEVASNCSTTLAAASNRAGSVSSFSTLPARRRRRRGCAAW